ncbi:MAG: COG4315 family predicted lipoprotein [Acidimicrobiales bacterium]
MSATRLGRPDVRRPAAVTGTRRSRHRRRRLRTWGGPILIVVACLLLAGCGGGTPSPTAESSATTTTIRAETIPGLGEILVDAGGYTLYIYSPDHARRSTCHGMCAGRWPPAVLPDGTARPTAGRGVRPSLLGTAARSGGARQVTYDGWPLYAYVDDGKPGAVTGQGADMGLWYTMSVSGTVDRASISASRS